MVMRHDGSDPAERASEEAGGMTRRTFAIGAVGAAAMFGLGALKMTPAEAICRPPGAQDEQRFLSACVHCEKCSEVCPQHAIRPARLESGLLVLRTPEMSYRTGWCDFCESTENGSPRCVECCPVGAFVLPQGSPSEGVVIGKARINEGWCLASKGMGCRECVDACPYEAMGISESGIPYVIEDVCNGCGACEFACISMSSGSLTAGVIDRAITVVPVSQEGGLR